MTAESMGLEDFRVRREILHTSGPAKEQAVAAEKARRMAEGPPGTVPTDAEVEDAIDRWLDPEPVNRALVTNAVWEMERHYWTRVSGLTHCQCGEHLGDAPTWELMRSHKEDVLASMLGLSIRPEASGE